MTLRTKIYLIGALALGLTACSSDGSPSGSDSDKSSTFSDADLTHQKFTPGSWADFLQHLPFQEGSVFNYRGEQVDAGRKSFAVLPYDVGRKDLQQCADALIRLRAEFLFSAGRPSDIAFHFTSGDLYTFTAYCEGLRPVISGNRVSFEPRAVAVEVNHDALRRYLDIVYTYAGTISLARELKPASGLQVGTVVIVPGSPGHCFMVVDDALTSSGEHLYKLVEGYTPAQTIYMLRNTAEPDLGAWQRLSTEGPIRTASYNFQQYRLGRFE